jgi:hypothetical protein
MRQGPQFAAVIDGHVRVALLVSEPNIGGHERGPFSAADNRRRMVFVGGDVRAARADTEWNSIPRQKADSERSRPRRFATDASVSGRQL